MDGSQKKDKIDNSSQIEQEFQYYTTLLKEIILWISDPALRQFVVNYVTQYSGTEVATNSKYRETRNRCLFKLSLAILNDNVFDLMIEKETIKSEISVSNITVRYKMFFDEHLPLLEKFRKDPETEFDCPKHGVVHECASMDTDLNNYSSLLLIYFWNLTSLNKIKLIRNPDHRQIATLWHHLITSMFLNGCAQVKDETLTLLIGLSICSSDFELKPPFTLEPKFPLRPLKLMRIKGYEEGDNDPRSFIAQQFVNSMPDIEEGGFAFISISSDLFERQS